MTARRGARLFDLQSTGVEGRPAVPRHPRQTEALTYSVVIPTKDRHALATAGVESLLDQVRLPQQLVVIDASDPPLELCPAIYERFRGAGVSLLVKHAEPSTSAQRNLGAQQVTSPIVLFMDDDVRLEPEYADLLLRRWEQSGLEAFGGMIGSPADVPEQGRLQSVIRRALMLHCIDDKHLGTTFRRSRKLAYVPRPACEVTIPAVATLATLFRVDLVRKHPFDEHFSGYVLGEDLDMSTRLSSDAPILQSPDVLFDHDSDPRERVSPLRWQYRGRCEAYFRLRHLGLSPLDLAAFAVSVLAEALHAALDSVRERRASHLTLYVAGLVQSLREVRAERRQSTVWPAETAASSGWRGPAPSYARKTARRER